MHRCCNNVLDYVGVVTVSAVSGIQVGSGGKLTSERDPVEPLSRSAKAYLHAPFDVRETRVCLGDNWRSSNWCHS
jgi:hypothetical protein